jgi:hypothetical protein
MTRWTNLLTIAFCLCIPTILSGCIVTGGCGEYEVCEQYCDGDGCFEDCWIEQDPYCDGGGYYDDGYYDDGEYSDGTTPLEDTRGVAGFCQTCEKDLDCVEPGALCIQINGTENVCARTCNSDNPCPRGFDCRDVSQQVGVSDQCVPIADEDDNNSRSCVIPEAAECLEDVDCASGEWCDQIEGKCTIGERPECQYNSQCAEGLLCNEDNKCVEEIVEPTPTCSETIACEEGNVCVDGECILETVEPSTCLTSSECSADEQCIDGTCTSPTQSCSADSDCDGQICTDNVCSAPECINNSECGETSLCVNARCEKSCQASEDCGFGYVCNDLNYCDPDPTIECRADDECTGELTCSTAGSCVQTCDASCECAEGLSCGEGGICEELDIPTSCTDDCECPSGQSCLEGVCNNP